jgi:hypothetical protein
MPVIMPISSHALRPLQENLGLMHEVRQLRVAAAASASMQQLQFGGSAASGNGGAAGTAALAARKSVVAPPLTGRTTIGGGGGGTGRVSVYRSSAVPSGRASVSAAAAHAIPTTAPAIPAITAVVPIPTPPVAEPVATEPQSNPFDALLSPEAAAAPEPSWSRRSSGSASIERRPLGPLHSSAGGVSFSAANMAVKATLPAAPSKVGVAGAAEAVGGDSVAAAPVQNTGEAPGECGTQ